MSFVANVRLARPGAGSMATYVIGDIQGCFESFMALLEAIDFRPTRDRLWLAGDLVNRGPASLEVLRWCHAHQNHVTAVLGNHDMYLLARAAGAAAIKDDDTLGPILEADDRNDLLDWLRHQPLIHRENDWLMVHAGLHPEWTVAEAETLARGIEALVATGDPAVMAKLRQKAPTQLAPKPSKTDRRRHGLRVMTRMRMLRDDGGLDDTYKGAPADAPLGLTPWFEWPHRAFCEVNVVFGHWSGLGLHVDDRVVCLDSGCVWGDSLSALRLEDRAIFSVPSQED